MSDTTVTLPLLITSTGLNMSFSSPNVFTVHFVFKKQPQLWIKYYMTAALSYIKPTRDLICTGANLLQLIINMITLQRVHIKRIPGGNRTWEF